ncbi:hypothetical protein L208DRAFT_1374628 [Tricholoma matsutake]|nr:hypothetical protein L208DRAFT_1374628 [Tricholoma matsutake 945]
MSSDSDHIEWAAPLTKTNTFVIKICAFGTAAVVGTIFLGILIYLLFFRKGHLQRKAARKEEVAKNLEKGILPTSKYYGIGKVPKKKYTPPPPTVKRYSKARAVSTPEPEKYTPPFERTRRPSKGAAPPRRSSLHNPKIPRDPTRTPRVSWGSDVTIDIPPPPKAMISQKTTASQ